MITELKGFVSNNPQCNVRYEFIPDLCEHLVEISSKILSAEKDIMNFRIFLRSKFDKEFPNDTILFITKDSLIQIEEL